MQNCGTLWKKYEKERVQRNLAKNEFIKGGGKRGLADRIP